ncbi:MAG: hypothetical protein FH751_15205 [Firmicutes bacterium]|nr:hypothetical protein [Bacillota bacterium]
MFLSIWFIYGFKYNLGIKRGLIVGLIGISDGILLQIITFLLYLNRGGYYFGPVTMIPWVVPFLGITDTVDFISDIFLCYMPFLALILTLLGSFLGEKYKSVKCRNWI